jgi:hypothetical protein
LWFTHQRTAAGFVSGNRSAVSGLYFALGGHIYGRGKRHADWRETLLMRADVIE